MERIDGKKFAGETVVLDDKLFVGCLFENCILVYYGGDLGWHSSAAHGCTFQFEGAAVRTIKHLKRLGMLAPDAPISTEPPEPAKIH